MNKYNRRHSGPNLSSGAMWIFGICGFAYIIYKIVSCNRAIKAVSSHEIQVINSDKTREIIINDSTNEIDFRKEFIALYQKPVFIDTSFFNKGKEYEVVFHHFSSMDNGLVVPAKYNFDTNKDFTTHNFVSDLAVLSDRDTVFKKHITKAIFNSMLDTLDTPLNKYATLLYPTLNLINDSIQIHYSISIPVTDVGIGVTIIFDMGGNSIVK